MFQSLHRSFHTSRIIQVSARRTRSQQKRKANIQKQESKKRLQEVDVIRSKPTEFISSLLVPKKVWNESSAPTSSVSRRVDEKTLKVIEEESEIKSSTTTVWERFSHIPPSFFLNDKDKKAIFQTLPTIVEDSQLSKMHSTAPSFTISLKEKRQEDTTRLKVALERSKDALQRITSLSNQSSKGIMVHNISKAIEQFGRGGNIYKDPGSPEVQAAVLTCRIQNLFTHLRSNPNDNSNYRGFNQLVHRRAKILRYLKQQSLDRYFITLKKLGLEPQAVEGEIKVPKLKRL